MRNRFDQQLEQMNNHLLEMGALIERSIENATQALIKQDVDAAKAAINADQEVDHKEREIESLCLKLLLQQQPVAKDLRLISAALKMITDMERIGDQAADISGIVCYIVGEPHIKELVHLPAMADAAILMVKGSLDAYVRKDVELARKVIDMDDEIDDLVAANDALIRRRADEILALITEPMTASEIVQAACEHFKLFSKRPARTLRFERNIRFFIEYLVDDGRLEMLFGKGTTAFQPAPQE